MSYNEGIWREAGTGVEEEADDTAEEACSYDLPNR
jgi:hypothetical protein